jgi:hypothetical protein
MCPFLARFLASRQPFLIPGNGKYGEYPFSINRHFVNNTGPQVCADRVDTQQSTLLVWPHYTGKLNKTNSPCSWRRSWLSRYKRFGLSIPVVGIEQVLRRDASNPCDSRSTGRGSAPCDPLNTTVIGPQKPHRDKRRMERSLASGASPDFGSRFDQSLNRRLFACLPVVNHRPAISNPPTLRVTTTTELLTSRDLYM